MPKIKPATRVRMNETYKRGLRDGEELLLARQKKVAEMMVREQAVLDNLGADEGNDGAE